MSSFFKLISWLDISKKKTFERKSKNTKTYNKVQNSSLLILHFNKATEND